MRPAPGDGGRVHPCWNSVRNALVALCVFTFALFVVAAWDMGRGHAEPAESDRMGHLCWSRDAKEARDRCFVACSDGDGAVVTFAPACANGGRDHCVCAPTVDP